MDGWIILGDCVGAIVNDVIFESVGLNRVDDWYIDGAVVGMNVKPSMVGEILGVETVGVFDRIVL